MLHLQFNRLRRKQAVHRLIDLFIGYAGRSEQHNVLQVAQLCFYGALCHRVIKDDPPPVIICAVLDFPWKNCAFPVTMVIPRAIAITDQTTFANRPQQKMNPLLSRLLRDRSTLRRYPLEFSQRRAVSTRMLQFLSLIHI